MCLHEVTKVGHFEQFKCSSDFTLFEKQRFYSTSSFETRLQTLSGFASGFVCNENTALAYVMKQRAERPTQTQLNSWKQNYPVQNKLSTNIFDTRGVTKDAWLWRGIQLSRWHDQRATSVDPNKQVGRVFDDKYRSCIKSYRRNRGVPVCPGAEGLAFLAVKWKKREPNRQLETKPLFGVGKDTLFWFSTIPITSTYTEDYLRNIFQSVWRHGFEHKRTPRECEELKIGIWTKISVLGHDFTLQKEHVLPIFRHSVK